MCRRLLPGHRFELTEHDAEPLNAGYVVTHVEHTGVTPEAAHGSLRVYENRFRGVPAEVPFRPARPARVVQPFAVARAHRDACVDIEARRLHRRVLVGRAKASPFDRGRRGRAVFREAQRGASEEGQSCMHASSGDSSGAVFERFSATRSSRRPRRHSQRRMRLSTRAATSAMSARVGAGPPLNTRALAASARKSPSGTKTCFELARARSSYGNGRARDLVAKDEVPRGRRARGRGALG